MTPGPRDPKLEAEQRRLSKQIKEINRSVVDDLKKALQLLNGETKEALDRAAYPSRQAWRQAQRAAQKAGR